MNKQQLLAEIKKTVLQQEPDAELMLFGSYARGDERPDSDIDILILVNKDKMTWEDENRIANPLYDLELKTMQVITPLIRTKKNWKEKYPNTGLYINIQKEGIPL